MKYLGCQNPVKIYLPYSNEPRYVPCGKCDACQQAHAQMWITRIKKEAEFWPFVVMSTLTYDDEHLPVMHKYGDTFVSTCRRHFADETPVVSREDVLHFDYKNELEKKASLEFFDSERVLPYVSVRDVQLFLKRLRKGIAQKTKEYLRNTPKELHFEDTAPILRYYIALEYGPTYYRPHVHCIFFFKSSVTAAYYKELINKAWSYGNTKSEFSQGFSAEYAAKYLNCTSHLPAVFQIGKMRPKSLFSRFPAIGTIADSPDKVRQIFDSCSPTQVVFDSKGTAPVNAPIWRYYQAKVFPRLTCFNSFTHYERTQLYSAAQRYGRNPQYDRVGIFDSCHVNEFDYKIFESNIKFELEVHKLSTPVTRPLLLMYAYQLMFNADKDPLNPLKRWFYISSRVCTMAQSFGVSVSEYVEHIERFYKNVDYYGLTEQFKFQEDFCVDNSAEFLLGMDRLTLERLISIPSQYATDSDAFILDSYGIDPSEFFAFDLKDRKNRFLHLFPECNMYGFSEIMSSQVRLAKSMKVCKKNEATGLLYNGISKKYNHL